MKLQSYRVVLAAAFALALGACGGGSPSNSGLPAAGGASAANGAANARGGAAFKITIPRVTAANAKQRHGQYVSVNTASASITLTTVNGAAAPAGYGPTTFGLTITSPGCLTDIVSGFTECTINAPAPPGTDVFTVTLFDSLQHALSTNSTTVTITGGQIATAPALVLGGIAASYVVTPAGDAATLAHVTPSGAGYRILGSRPYIFSIAPVDASGATIIGPGTPTVALTSASSAVTATAAIGPGNTYHVQVATDSVDPVSLTAQSTGGASLTIPITAASEYWFSETPNTGTTKFVRAFSISGTTATEIASDTITLADNEPWGMAVDPSGNLWVSFGSSGFIASFAPGSPTPLVSTTAVSGVWPYNIALDTSGNLWATARVINFFNPSPFGGIVKEYSPTSGSLVQTILPNTLHGNGPITFDAAGRLWVGDASGQTVAGYSASGQLVRSLDFTGSNPSALAFDGAGRLWVASQAAGPVGSLSAYDTSTGAIVPGSTITGGGLTTPVSINVDAAGNMWVLNMLDPAQNSNVYVYSSTGELLRTVTILSGGANTDGVNAMAVSP